MAPNPFSESLARFRELAGMTQKQLSQKSHMAHSSINRWEKGGNLPKRDRVETLDKILGCQGKLLAAWRLARGGQPEWARSLAAIEESAVALSVVSPVLTPGYLQSPAYAQYVFSAGLPLASPDEIARLVQMRCGRLEQLPDLRVSAVFPIVGITGVPREIAVDQARHLLDWVDTGRVTIQLVPQGHVLPVPTSPVMLFRQRSGELVATSDHADGSVTLAADAHDRVSALFTASLAASLPARLSLDALKDITHESQA